MDGQGERGGAAIVFLLVGIRDDHIPRLNTRSSTGSMEQGQASNVYLPKK